MNRPFKFLRLYGAVLAVLVAGSESAQTYYVAPNGNDAHAGTQARPWKTIQKAAETLVAGDGVYVRGGVYRERVMVQHAGAPDAYIRFLAYPGEQPIVDGQGIDVPDYGALFELSLRSYVQVSGFTVRNIGPNRYPVGILTDAPGEDFDERLRPQGSGYDLGAYEYGDAPTRHESALSVRDATAQLTCARPGKTAWLSFLARNTADTKVTVQSVKLDSALFHLGSFKPTTVPAGGMVKLNVKVVCNQAGKFPPPFAATFTTDEPGAPSPNAAVWRPPLQSSWQIQFTKLPIRFSVNAQRYEIDLFDHEAGTAAALHAIGREAICYINVGSWEDWRADAGQFPAEVLGKDYAGWEGEKWLDIRRLDLLGPIMRARLDQCRAKGFDGVEPDNIDAYTNDTGFPLTAEDQLAYNLWLANEAHARGLSIGLKNDPDQIAELLPHFDWALTESCFAQGWCEQLIPFIQAGKPVFAIEYTEEGMNTKKFCNQAKTLRINAILKRRVLDGWRQACP